MRIVISQINPIIGDFPGNTQKILKGISAAREQKADGILFPELALSGYPPEDFLQQHHFLDTAQESLKKVIEASKGLFVVVGLPRYNPDRMEKFLHNSAAVIDNGQLLGFQDKILLPTYDVFDERRYFEPGQTTPLWTLGGKKVGITICEDIWQHSEQLKETIYSQDPVVQLAKEQPELMINISASPYSVNKEFHRLAVVKNAAKTLKCPVILCNQVGGNDSLIFDGHSVYVGPEGHLYALGKAFEEDQLLIDLDYPYTPVIFEENCTENLYKALVLGVKDYFQKSGFKKACLGLSGGIDSALVACIASDALGASNVLGVTMPSRYSSEGSVKDSQALAQHLGIPCKEIPIESPFTSYLNLLQLHFEGKGPDATEENLQARIRGMLLMALSNKLGYIVLSTGNKSELAMGYSTLYGDMCGGLAVISDITKMQVYALANWINHEKEIIPWNTIYKPPSAELRPNQKDSDSLPDYSIVDHVLQAYIEEHRSPKEISERYGYSQELVNDLVQRIHRNEYKRRQSPLGLRVSEKAFSIGRRFPIVQKFS